MSYRIREWKSLKNGRWTATFDPGFTQTILTFYSNLGGCGPLDFGSSSQLDLGDKGFVSGAFWIPATSLARQADIR